MVVPPESRGPTTVGAQRLEPSGAVPADRFLLSDQFLHKALLVTVHELPGGVAVAVVLNRPTANLVQFHTDGKPRRCINFGGDGRMMGNTLGVNAYERPPMRARPANDSLRP